MNYYPLHIGDYLRDTSHLTMLEDGAYRRMLDLYYASEKPLPVNLDGLYRLLRARSRPEREAVDTVLKEFFDRREDGWHNARADAEISKAQEKGTKARLSAVKRWHSGGNANASAPAMRTHSEGNAPNSQEPKAREGRGSRLPADWTPSDELRAWAVSARSDLDISATVEKFRDYWTAKPGRGGVKLDWEATFRNWVREEKPGRQTPAQLSPARGVDLGTCPCGAPAVVKVGNKPRCSAHQRGGLENAA